MTEQAGHYWPGRPILWVVGVLLLSCLLWQPNAHAVNGQCTSAFAASGTITTTSTLYQPGATSSGSFATTSSANCNCMGITLYTTTYYQATTTLPTISESDGVYLKLSNQLALKVEFNIDGTGRRVPFTPITSTALLGACVGGLLDLSLLGGIKVNGGTYTLKLLTGITGTKTYSGTVASLFVRRVSVPDVTVGNEFSQLAMNISVTSTPTCQFPAGTSIPIDLGAVAQSAFVEGDVPKGYAPRSVNVSVTCSQIPSDYTVPLSYSFGGALSSQNRFIATSLAGVGVGMLEQDTQTSIPFDTVIAVPYSAATNNTNYKVRLYPTRLPGQVVRTGAYTGTIMVTVSVP